MRAMLYSLLAALLIVSAATAYNFNQIVAARNSSRSETCVAFATYNAAIVKIINQGEQALPSFAYYREHPDDLARAVQADENAKKLLAASTPSYC